jgi:hypothetical protein
MVILGLINKLVDSPVNIVLYKQSAEQSLTHGMLDNAYSCMNRVCTNKVQNKCLLAHHKLTDSA